MRIVTILARRRAHIAALHRTTVNTRAVTVRLPLVTRAAIHWLRGDVVIGMFGREIGMATDASIRRVRGRAQLRFIHEQ